MPQKNIIYTVIVLFILGIAIGFLLQTQEITNDTISKETNKNYISNDLELCPLIQFLCIEGKERFDDSIGCGCQDVILKACTSDAKICPDGSVVSRDGNNNCEFFPCSDEIKCDAESRNAEACIEIYQPVCAKVRVDCITTPCDPIKQEFSNSCFACINSRTLSYTEGECN